MSKKDYNKFLNLEDNIENSDDPKDGSFIHLASTKYNIGVPYRFNDMSINEVAVHDLVTFQGNTPFQDYTGTEKFDTLVREIDENGILTPVILRTLPNGKYEILAGYHRCEAAKYLHHASVPAIVYPVDLSDAKAMMIHLSTNLLNGRDQMSLYETIRAMVEYEQTLDYLRGQRHDLHAGEKYDRYQQLAEVFKIGNKTTAVQYLKAGKEMPDDILHMVSNGMLAFSVAYKILQQEPILQEELYEYCRKGKKLTAKKLEKLIEAKKNTTEILDQINIENNIQESNIPTKNITNVVDQETTIIPIQQNPETISIQEFNRNVESNNQNYITIKLTTSSVPTWFQHLPEATKEKVILDVITLLKEDDINHIDKI